jgi:hypothetical protein
LNAEADPYQEGELESRMKIRTLERLANSFPYLVLSAFIAGVIFCFLIDRMDYLINGSILAIPAITGSIVFILIKKKDLDLSENLRLFSSSPALSAMFFMLIFSLTIVALLITPAESKWGLSAVLILYATILVQILSRRMLPAVVLLETVLTLAVTIYSYTLRSALYFGATDTMPHIYMATVTYLSGHIIPREIGTYTYFPLYHVFIAQSAHVLGLDIQTALFVTTGLIYSLTVLFLYFLVNSVFRNEQISLLIVLAYAMNTSVVYYGTYMVTRTMAYVGFLILMYMLYSLAYPKTNADHAVGRSTAPRFLAVIMVVFILLTHQITTPMIIILLGLLFFLGLFIRDRGRVSLLFLVVPITLFATYWTFVAYSFLWELLPRTDPSLYKDIVIAPVVYQGLSFLMNQIDTLFIVFFSLVGGTYLVWKQKPRYAVVFGVLGLISILLNVPNVLSMVFQLMTILRIDRFALLFLPFLAIAMGVGIYVFARYLSFAKPSSRWVGILLIAMLVLYGIGSLGFVRDEPGYKRYSFNQEEIVGFDYVLKTVPSGSDLYSDYYTSRFFERQKINESERLGLPHYVNHLLQSNLEVSEGRGYLIILNNQLQHNGLLFGLEDETNPENFQPYPPTEENIRNVSRIVSVEDKIYSNYDVDLYHFLN